MLHALILRRIICCTFQISLIAVTGEKYLVHNRSSPLLQVYAEELLCEDADDEGKHRDADADKRHLRKAGLERLVLSDAGVISEACDDEDYDSQHADKSGDVMGSGEDEVRCDKGNNRQQIRNARVRA